MLGERCPFLLGDLLVPHLHVDATGLPVSHFGVSSNRDGLYSMLLCKHIVCTCILQYNLIYLIYTPRTQMDHMLKDLTHKMEGQPLIIYEQNLLKSLPKNTHFEPCFFDITICSQDPSRPLRVTPESGDPP